jgi:hypothetical protein
MPTPHPHITYTPIFILSSNVRLRHPTGSTLENYCANFCMQFSSARARHTSDHLSHPPWYYQRIPEDLLFSSSSYYFLHNAQIFSSAKHSQTSPMKTPTLRCDKTLGLLTDFGKQLPTKKKKRLNCSYKQVLP